MRLFWQFLLTGIIAAPFNTAAAQDNPFVTIPFKNAAYSGPGGFTEYARIYFFISHPGNLQVSLKIKASDGAKLRIQHNLNEGEEYTVKVKKAKDYIVVPVGNFLVDSVGYHFLGIQDMLHGNRFPDIESVIVSGTTADGIIFNNSVYRGAPATHLSYPLPQDSAASWFYSEIKVPADAQAMHAYYMTNGFSGGYMGIQINSPVERRVLFSIWSDYKTDDPKEIPEDYAVTLVRKGEGVHSGNFGNEGSGGQTYLAFDWKADTVYKLLVTATPDGNNTTYAGYFFAPEKGKWMLLGEWYKKKTGGKLLKGLYSFVENFGENGNELFKAYYGNQWIKTSSGNWLELTKSKFSTTANPVKHPRLDYGGGVENNWFYMFSGGFKNAGITKPGDVYERKENGIAPQIDSLP